MSRYPRFLIDVEASAARLAGAVDVDVKAGLISVAPLAVESESTDENTTRHQADSQECGPLLFVRS